MRELFGYKTLNTKEARSSLSKKPFKNMLRVSFIYETTEKKAAVAKKARALIESKSAELEVQLGGTELKLAEAQSLNTTLTEELAI